MKKTLLITGALAAGLAALADSRPAFAACERHCWQDCTYEVAGKCYVWANRCEVVCSLRDGKNLVYGPDGNFYVERPAPKGKRVPGTKQPGLRAPVGKGVFQQPPKGPSGPILKSGRR